MPLGLSREPERASPPSTPDGTTERTVLHANLSRSFPAARLGGILSPMLTDKVVFAFSLVATAYCAFLALDFYVFKLEWILLGVLGELLTIPMFLAVAAVFVFLVVRLLANRQSMNAWNVSSAVILFVLNCFIWGSFLF